MPVLSNVDLDQLDNRNNINNNQLPPAQQLMYQENGNPAATGNEEEKLATGVQYHDQYFKQMKVNQWVKVLSQGQIFTPRTGHECIFADGNIYLFAGTDDDERLNDLYNYSIRKNRWTKIDPIGDKP